MRTTLIATHPLPAGSHSLITVDQPGTLRAGRQIQRSTAILAIVCISYFMVILDNSIIFTGLPRIQASLHFSSTGLAWVQDAYTLVFGGLLLLGARAGDIIGRRRAFNIGLVLFAGASLLVGLAQAEWWIIAARAFQGVGAALLAPSSLALLTATFAEGKERSRAVAAYSAVAGIGASAGLVVGGVLADLVSWRAGFFINVPIGLAMLIASRRWLTSEPEPRGGRFDLVGALCATLGVGALVYATIHGAESGWDSTAIGAFVLGGVLIGGLVVNEAKVADPIMPLRLFASRVRTGAYVTRFLYLAAMIGFFFFTTQFLQGVLGYSPLTAGLAFMPMTIVNFAVAIRIGRVIKRFGSSSTLVAGVALTLVGMAWLSRVGIGSDYFTAVALPMLLIGAGQGLAFAPMTSAGLIGVKGADAGASSGVINTFHQLGSSLGLGVLTAIAAAAVPNHASAAAALAQRVGTALTAGSGFLLVCLAVVLVLVVRPAAQRSAAPK
jgi:EmrB/QacA subfamily drug resistance transporter